MQDQKVHYQVNQHKMSYKILEENEDPRLTVIEKSELTAQYTLADIERNIDEVERVLRELDGKLRIEAAKCKNVEEHHPFVLEMSDDDLSTAAFYAEAKQYTKQIPEKIKQAEEVLANERKEQAEAKKLLGLEEDGGDSK